MVAKNIMPRTGNLLLTKELFFSLGGFDERVSYNEDYGFLLKMLSTYEIFIVKDLIMVYTDDNKSLSTRRTPLESEFGNYMCSLSIENIYRRVLIYQQYIFTYKRRLAIGDKDGAIKVKNELNLRFSLLMKYTAWIMSKFSSVYNKKYVYINIVLIQKYNSVNMIKDLLKWLYFTIKYKKKKYIYLLLLK